jgi:hypothetical protein
MKTLDQIFNAALILAVIMLFVMHADAQQSQRSFYDSRGSFAGSTSTHGNTTSAYDRIFPVMRSATRTGRRAITTDAAASAARPRGHASPAGERCLSCRCTCSNRLQPVNLKGVNRDDARGTATRPCATSRPNHAASVQVTAPAHVTVKLPDTIIGE